MINISSGGVEKTNAIDAQRHCISELELVNKWCAALVDFLAVRLGQRDEPVVDAVRIARLQVRVLGR